MKKQKKEIWKEQISDRFELPKDLVFGDTFIHLIGHSELYIENYRGIAVYQEECIRLNIRGGQLEVKGKNLFIQHYSEYSMKITGCIQQICYL